MKKYKNSNGWQLTGYCAECAYKERLWNKGTYKE